MSYPLPWELPAEQGGDDRGIFPNLPQKWLSISDISRKEIKVASAGWKVPPIRARRLAAKQKRRVREDGEEVVCRRVELGYDG